MRNFKQAMPEDAEFLSALAKRSKAHWEYPQEWMNKWRDELMVEPEYISSNSVVMLELNNVVVGFYGIA